MKLKKLLSIIALTALFTVQILPVSAQEAPPQPPTAPTAPVAPTAPPAPTAPTAPTPPPPPPPPLPAEALAEEGPSPTEVPTASTQSEEPTSLPEETSGQTQDGNSGDTNITTGDANNSGVVVSEANNNLLADSGPGILEVVNEGNGAESQNTGSVTVAETNTSVQQNEAEVQNNLDLGSVTGQNSASYTTGGDANIKTGDANVSGTAITAVNTNVDAVSVSEFNIADNHVGDYILDFAANCVSGCSSGDAVAKNSGNGANSVNDADISQDVNNLDFQSNSATVGNSMILNADSGANQANYQTGGDSNITTGDANVSASSLTLANNNLSGNVIYGVVNIYGDLIGDIIFPEEALAGCCASSATAANIGNGADSTNTANIDSTLTDSTIQSNDVVIENTLVLDADTGANKTSGNTGGDSAISTGDSNVTAQVLNVANSNISGGTWWLVLVNEAGQWIGRILGAPVGANYAGSADTQFTVGQSGEITAVNSGNGSGSTNDANVSQTTTNTTVQTNSATVQNDLKLTANTGGNSASYNTNGDSNIQTGDATIMANIVNFVNNNVTGGGKLFVTVVNVFGSWLGDFVTPGSHKTPPVAEVPAPAPEPAVGGAEIPAVQSSTSNPSDSSNSSNSSPSVASVSVQSRVIRRRVAGLSTSFPSVESPVLASESVVSPDPGPARNKVRINLAWLLLGLPLLLPVYLRFRRPRIVQV
ncbi:MAG: Uncharacterized protein G01um101416_206 [Microgenomates group bacterium Gr01-1014_16]|nr:MAG: Uncharacterized protein G01um101416_206 [Microgenomates group bacterium Gr01-1014_16]